jgi:P27 family predicted phage terminase small subunit
VDAPAYFSDAQRVVWDYAIAHAPAGLLKLLDTSVLEIWVVACVFHREAVQRVGASGQVIKTQAGYPITSPYLSNANKQAQIMLKAASEMGFTPASRTRIVVTPEAVSTNKWSKFATT